MRVVAGAIAITVAALLLGGCEKTDRELLADARDWVNVQTLKEYQANRDHCLWESAQRSKAAHSAEGGRALSYPCNNYFDRSQRNVFSDIQVYHRKGHDAVCGSVSGVDLLGNLLRKEFVVFERTVKMGIAHFTERPDKEMPAEYQWMKENYQDFWRFYHQYCINEQ